MEIDNSTLAAEQKFFEGVIKTAQNSKRRRGVIVALSAFIALLSAYGAMTAGPEKDKNDAKINIVGMSASLIVCALGHVSYVAARKRQRIGEDQLTHSRED